MGKRLSQTEMNNSEQAIADSQKRVDTSSELAKLLFRTCAYHNRSSPKQKAMLANVNEDFVGVVDPVVAPQTQKAKTQINRDLRWSLWSLLGILRFIIQFWYVKIFGKMSL